MDDYPDDSREDPLPTQSPPPPPPSHSEMSHVLDAIRDMSTHVTNMDTHVSNHKTKEPPANGHDRRPPAPYDPYDVTSMPNLDNYWNHIQKSI
ncbi:unnamed protein product [Spirodela intermedia]|uniref:Uncharacterized protein n=1 Tax=Spirodela intermedia TaxID=51605 RepID=A0A7I8JGE1_SPIIN|nr:unnamed protein product [Spirodela intermedia]CAA6668583.1 unnamed protein product [Spirodela intermedia]